MHFWNLYFAPIILSIYRYPFISFNDHLPMSNDPARLQKNLFMLFIINIALWNFQEQLRQSSSSTLLEVELLFTYEFEHSFDLAERLQHYCSGRCSLCWKPVSYVTSGKSRLIGSGDYTRKLKIVVQSKLIPASDKIIYLSLITYLDRNNHIPAQRHNAILLYNPRNIIFIL